MKADPDTISQLRDLHSKYIHEIDSSNLTRLSAKVYKVHSENFIRWIEGSFIPGAKSSRLKN